MAGDDQEFLKTLTDLYLSETEQHLVRLEMALDSNDHQLVRREAHAIRGSSLNAGASNLGNLAGRLEELDPAVREGLCRRLLRDMKVEFIHVRCFLREAIQA